MKINKLLFLLCLNFISSQILGQSSECGNQTVIISESKPIDWSYPEVLVFQDSFDGPELDENLWGFGFPWGKILTEASLEGMTEENLSFSDGELIIKTEYRPNNFDRFLFQDGQLVGTEPVRKEYSSAGIFSRIEFTRGFFELDYKIDAITAQWPAFWLLGDCQQEVDIFEYFYGKSAFHDNWTEEITYTLHQDYNCADPQKCRLIKNYFRETDFHKESLYSALNWSEHKLSFYSTAEKPDWEHFRWRDFSYRPIAYPEEGDILFQSSYYPFDKPMRLLIGQGVHENINHKIHGSPRYFKLNVVKVWQKADPNGKFRLNKNFDYSGSYDGIVCGQQIIIEDNSPFDHKDYLIARALEEIELRPGFDSGSRLVDLKVPKTGEIRDPNPDDLLQLTPETISSIRFYNLQGLCILEAENLMTPKHLEDEKINELRGNNNLYGLYIIVTQFSDGSRKTQKINYFNR